MNNTIKFFLEISKIPRESGNEKKISEYLCEFAKKRELEYTKDQWNNVIIKKKTIDKSPIILQAHQDMVCEKEVEKIINFDTDPIEIFEDNGYLKAKGTTLGADNGIGIAQILNILDSDIKCNIEAIFTVEEETTMKGAENIRLDNLKGKQMISLDGFDKNTVVIGSASFSDIVLMHKYKFNKIEEKSNIYKISLKGLKGGHSGADINKNRGNASILLATFLKQIKDIKLFNFIGGTQFNVIPSNAEAIFNCDEDKAVLEKKIKEFEYTYKKQYKDINIKIKEIEYAEHDGLSNKDSIKYLNSICVLKNGVFKQKNKDEVTTSMNLGVVNLKDGVFLIGMRSSKKIEEKECIKYIKKYALENNLIFKVTNYQPGFETDENSMLVKKMVKAFKKSNFKENVDIKSLHFTVEAGIIANRKKGLEIIIVSPEVKNAHSPCECVNINSIYKCDEWLKNFLLNY